MGDQTRPWGPSGSHPPLKLGEADADTSEMLSVCQEPLEVMVHPAGPCGWEQPAVLGGDLGFAEPHEATEAAVAGGGTRNRAGSLGQH